MRHFTPKQTHAFLQERADAALVDCRSEIEYMYVGHPPGAMHVAWQEYPDWEINQRFADEVLREVGDKLRTVVLICRSGKRTLAAGKMLEEAGFADVINVLHGFEGDLDDQMRRNTLNGWRFDGLPWEQM